MSFSILENISRTNRLSLILFYLEEKQKSTYDKVSVIQIEPYPETYVKLSPDQCFASTYLVYTTHHK